jgi:hypothetical protein
MVLTTADQVRHTMIREISLFYLELSLKHHLANHRIRTTAMLTSMSAKLPVTKSQEAMQTVSSTH